jgi:penicillin-binding protein 1C
MLTRRSERRLFAAVGAAVFALSLGVPAACDSYLRHLGPLDLSASRIGSTIVVDRDGRLLRAFTLPDGRWRLPVTATEVDPRYLAMLIGYEDGRFYDHDGVDFRAMARAAWQWATRGHVVSGGSTLTMQVARLIEPRDKRNLPHKLRQITRALQMEQRIRKDGVLDRYLTLAPFGGNLEGARAASLAYFGKEPRRLTIAEAALLVALPQAPESRRPDKYPEAARRARARVLDRVAARGIITPEEASAAKREPIPQSRKDFPALAAHAAEEAVAADPSAQVLRLSLDARLQAKLEALAKESVERLGPKLSAAIVVIDNASGEIRVRIGAADFSDASRDGAIDMSRAPRSPGSALKPFIYALAFEQGLAHIGPATFLARLHGAGAEIALPKDTPIGLAIGLGGLGVSLVDIARLYAGLARGGEAPALFERLDGASPIIGPKRVTDPVAAFYVADILRGSPPPDNSLSGRIAFKTGTSYGFRDALAIGFDRATTIAVWVGRPDNGPTPGLVGRQAAAPILFDAFARLGRNVELIHPPKGVLRVATSAELPPPLRHLRSDAPKTIAATAATALKIAFPPDGARIDLGLKEGARSELSLKALGGALPLTWFVNGEPVGDPDSHRQSTWKPDGAGFARVSVIDAKGATDSIWVRVE